MKVAYVRVSTEEQNLDRQLDAMKALNVEKVFEEKISGKNLDRPTLKEMLAFVRQGDTLIIESISRLARSTRDLLTIVEQLHVKGVRLMSLKESLDTETPQGRFVLTMFAAMAELERDTTLQRQAEGIAAAKARGKNLGRPEVAKPADFDATARRVAAAEMTSVQAMKKLGLSKTTYYRLLRGEKA